MKSLKEYVNNSYSVNNIIIENELELHFYAEFIVGSTSFDEIIEKHGSYLGQKELVLDLAKEIYLSVDNHDPEDTFTLNKEDLEDYSNIFFNTLNIYITNNFTGYKSDKSKYIKSDKIFDKVDIYLNAQEDCDSYKSIAIALMHEILHAWNNYQSFYKGEKFNLTKLTDKNSKYYKTLFNNGKINISNICKRICNNISQIEQNAYLNELNIALETSDFNIDKYKTYEEASMAAYEIFIKTDVWNQYSILWDFLNNLKSKNGYSEEDQKEFKDEYNRINDTNLSFSRIYSKLDGLFNKILKKMESRVPKIFKDYYNEQINKIVKENAGLIRGSSDFIKELNMINEYKSKSSVKADNNLDWEVYFNNSLDKTFTKWSKNWKRKPQVGHGWYTGGTIFKIYKIEDNKVYVKEDDSIKP